MGQAALARQIDDTEVALRLREEIARRRISRQGLADTARLSMSTLEKALSGRRRFTLATVVRLEEALGTSLRSQTPEKLPNPESVAAPATVSGLAPIEMGAYSRAAVQWIENRYVTLRASFHHAHALFAYRTRIHWCEQAGHLVFAESERVDACFTQSGFVSMPTLSGQIHLVTSVNGQFRTAALGVATHEMRLYGILSTLQAGNGSRLMPVACPIALVPEEQLPGVLFGVIEQGDAAYATCRKVLDTVTQGSFARICG